MREKMDEQPKKQKKRKKRSKFGYYLYAVIVLFLTIANVTLGTYLLTYVQGIKVYGTKYSNSAKIVEWIKQDPLTQNSIYAVAKHAFGKEAIPPYLQQVKVGWAKPWELKVTVQEKEIIGSVLSGNSYVYFAKDGTVMRVESGLIEGIPVVEGIDADKTALYEPLHFVNEKQFSYLVSVIEEVQKVNLKPDRIVWEEDSMNLYFEQICVKMGKLNYDEKVIQIPPILEKLTDEKGTVHLEHYNEMSTNISFEKDEE